MFENLNFETFQECTFEFLRLSLAPTHPNVCWTWATFHYVGSGDDDFSQTSFNNNQNPKKTANWPTREDPYDSYVDPYDNSRGSQDNRQTYYSTSVND